MRRGTWVLKMREICEREFRFSKWVKFRYSLGTLGFLIKFKYMVALTNETQTILSFLIIFKFNVFEFN
jgi:hypothetical protein